MEAIAFTIRRNLETLEDIGIKTAEIRSLGGGSRSQVWGQIKADVTRRPVLTMQNEEAGCLGAAILAGTAVGIYPSLDQAIQKMVALKSRLEPNPANAGIYDQAYRRYIALYDALVPVYARE